MTRACSKQCPLDIDVKAEHVEGAQEPRSASVLGRAEKAENAQSAADARTPRASMATAMRRDPLEQSPMQRCWLWASQQRSARPSQWWARSGCRGSDRRCRHPAVRMRWRDGSPAVAGHHLTSSCSRRAPPSMNGTPAYAGPRRCGKQDGGRGPAAAQAARSTRGSQLNSWSVRPTVTDSDEATVFEGVYVAHWEVARFVVTVGSRLFGLLPKREAWRAHLPHGFEFPDSDAHGRHSPGRFYDIRVRGRLGPPGRFGHMGICKRELFVDEVLSCEPTTNRPRFPA